MRSNRGKNGITACPRPFLRDCLSFLGFGNGRFCNFNFKRAPQRFYTFRVVLFFCVGLWSWFSPVPLLAEFESDDSVNLRDIKNDVNTIMTTNEHIYDFIRGSLLTYGGNINTVGWTLDLMQDDVDVIRDQSVELFNVLGYGSYSSRSGSLKQSLNTLINYLGYGSGSSQSSHLTSIVNQTNQIKSALGGDMYNTIADRLDDIINALNSPTPTDYATENTLSTFKNQNHTDITAFQSKYEDIANQFLTSWGFSGGSGGTLKDVLLSSSPTDYATENTLSTFKNQNHTDITAFQSKYEDNSNQFLTSWGFSGGSGGTLKDALTSLVPVMQNWNGTYPESWKTDPSPFPTDENTGGTWMGWTGASESAKVAPLARDIGNVLHTRFTTLMNVVYHGNKKQSWNDWYAHTNMVAQIVAQVDRIVLPPEDGRQDSTFDPNTGEIITPASGGGSSTDEVISIKPSYTNDFAVIEQDSTTVTNSLDFIEQKKIKDRYISDNMLDVGTYQDYGTAGGNFSGVIQFDSFKINFADHYDQYRMIVSIKNLDMLRNAMHWIWRFLACVSAFWFVLKIANISSSEAAG